MKKLLITSIFLLGFLAGNAQVSAGPKLGITFANVKGDPGDKLNKYKLGYYGGGYLKYDFSDRIFLQGEALYVKRGYKALLTTGSIDSNLTYTFNYVDLPLLLGINVMPGAFVHLGTQVGFLANVRTKGTVSNKSSQTSGSLDVSNIYGYSTTEYSVVLGGGYEFSFPLVTSLRFIYGATRLCEGNRLSHNMSFEFSVAYRFGNSSSSGGGHGNGVIYKRI